MDTNDRPSPARRGDALIRLRTVTTGVAVAGIAATAGFGFAAASGYRGAGASTDGSDPASTQAPIEQPVSGGDGSSPGGQSQQTSPPQLTTPQQVAPPNAGVQPPTQTNGRHGHATTGGSGQGG